MTNHERWPIGIDSEREREKEIDRERGSKELDLSVHMDNYDDDDVMISF